MRYSIKRMGQRGVTLVELVIALALLAILSTTSVLMCNSITSLVKYNRDTYADIENLTFTRTYIEKWFYTYDNSDYVYKINNDGSLEIKINNNNEENATISIDNDTETIKFNYIKPGDESNQSFSEYTFKGIKKILFEEINYSSTENVNSTESASLYKCTIKYDDNEFFFVLSKNSK